MSKIATRMLIEEMMNEPTPPRPNIAVFVCERTVEAGGTVELHEGGHVLGLISPINLEPDDCVIAITDIGRPLTIWRQGEIAYRW
jgi:hypothetical protein